MLKTITPQDMRALEQSAFAAGTADGETLMRRAAAHVAKAADRALPPNGTALFVCGCGNNGGDGLLAACLLLTDRADAHAAVLCLSGTPSPDHRRELKRLTDAFAADDRLRLCTLAEADALPVCDVIIDAMFGTGLCRELSGEAAGLCALINRMHECGSTVIAVDIPSGLNGSDGRVLGCCVHADETVTFHRPKPGLFLREGPEMCGAVYTADIGLSDGPALPGYDVLELSDLKRLLPKRSANAHKGTCGRVLLVCGSFGMAGAAGLCANAALRAGAGLCTVAVPERIVPTVQQLAPCATCLPLPQDPAEAAEALRAQILRSDAVACGCGLGQSDFAEAMLNTVIDACREAGIPCVLDADALNLLAQTETVLPLGPTFWLTPHPGEAARLLHTGIAEVGEDPEAALEGLRTRYGANVLLKGSRTLMADADGGLSVNPFGTPALATGGSGDVLCGVLAALLAGGRSGQHALTPLQAMQCACALHGLSGMAAEARYGERGVLASDLPAYLWKFASES